MLIKIIVIALLLVVVGSLASGLVFMIKDKGGSDRAVKALTLRVALSIAAFVLLMVGYFAGFIHPHGIYQ